MSIDNYGELKDAVLEWSNRNASWTGAARIPDFIRRAHDRINRLIRAQEGEHRAYIDTVKAQAYYPLHPHMIEVRKVTVQSTPRVTLAATTPSQMDRLYTTQQTNIPKHYTVTANQFRLGPIPSGEWPMEIVYSRKLDFFPDDAASNWVLDNHPFLYVHGSLAELHRYAKNYAASKESDEQFTLIGMEIEDLDLQKAYSGMRQASPYQQETA